jgi:5-methyltetrahydropteroyltriglutamate--homocysteine methyltransferase
MHGSQHRIMTTHVGSLPRPRPLLDLLIRQQRGEVIDEGEFTRQVDSIEYVLDTDCGAGK